jgi:hypothetical protein
MIDFIVNYMTKLKGYLYFYIASWCSPKEKIWYYHKATEYDYIPAIRKLALIYSGHDLSLCWYGYDIDKALKLYNKGIQLNDPICMNDLGYLYLYLDCIENKVVSVYNKALQLFLKSYELGYIDSLLNIKNVYMSLGNYKLQAYYTALIYKTNDPFLIRNSNPVESVIRLVRLHNLKWNTTIHCCWSMDMTVINNTVRTLLLISKYRKDSKYHYIHNAMIKGITMTVIKYYMELH